MIVGMEEGGAIGLAEVFCSHSSGAETGGTVEGENENLVLRFESSDPGLSTDNIPYSLPVIYPLRREGKRLVLYHSLGSQLSDTAGSARSS